MFGMGYILERRKSKMRIEISENQLLIAEKIIDRTRRIIALVEDPDYGRMDILDGEVREIRKLIIAYYRIKCGAYLRDVTRPRQDNQADDAFERLKL